MTFKFKIENLDLSHLRARARTVTIRIGKFCMVTSIGWGPCL